MIGAYVNVAVDPDRDRARQLVRGSAATFARFSAEAASAAGRSNSQAVGRLAREYQKDLHGQASATFAQQLDDEFIDRFAACGPPDEVRGRLSELAGCGLDRLIVVPCSLDTDPESMWRSNELFARQVLPGLANA
jgi:alkanesulfonate monooxygenase SsuD/methylene tetrahydromethanopterin reductase-like flavin-dependent oxidoreductase (luciferase family)